MGNTMRCRKQNSSDIHSRVSDTLRFNKPQCHGSSQYRKFIVSPQVREHDFEKNKMSKTICQTIKSLMNFIFN